MKPETKTNEAKNTTETKSPRRKRRDASKIEATLHDVLDTVDQALAAVDAGADCRVLLLAAQAQGRGDDMTAFWRGVALTRDSLDPEVIYQRPS